MNWLLSLVVACVMGAGAGPPGDATSSPAAIESPAPSPAPKIETVDDLLDAVTASDANIKTLHTTIRYETVQDLLDDTQVRKGTAELSISRDRRLKQFRVSFTQYITARGLEEQSRDYIFDGRYLVERLNDEKQFIKREVVRPGEEIDPLRIDGPLPLPIGQSRDSILKRFEASMPEREADESDRLKGAYRLHLAAREKNDDLETVDLWYNPQTFLPQRALITQRSGDLVKVDLANTRINDAEIDASDFSTQTPPKEDGWRVDIVPLEK